MKRKLLFLFVACLLLTGCGNKKEKVVEQEKKENVKYEHAFSVSDDDQVYIASSNLWYNPKIDEWKFAPEAYDYIGDDNLNYSDDYDGYLDLFSWGSTGYKLSPIFYDEDSSLYGNGHNNLDGTNYDFGVYLADKIGEGYRMFTHDEIHYLLMFRENATNLFGYGTINDVRGLFILPDDWKDVDGVEFITSVSKGFANQYDWYYTIGDSNDNYTYNNYSIDDWKKLEEAGAIFLPAAGIRFGDEMYHTGISGHYWTSSYYGTEFANCLCLFEKDLFLEGNFDRNSALSIRLVKDAK